MPVEASAFIIPAGSGGSGGQIGIYAAVHQSGHYVSGANVSISCVGPGVNLTVTGVTAPRSSWQSSNIAIPDGADHCFWTVLNAVFDAVAAARGQYTFTGSATVAGTAVGTF